jgi:hypothetical protein
MRVHLVAADALAQVFQGRGDVVSSGEPVPADADLYLFGSGHEAMKRLDRGLVVLDLRAGAGLTSAAWSAYADLCLVPDTSARTALVEAAGCEPERVFVASDSQVALDLLDRALRDELLPAVVEKEDNPLPDETSPDFSGLAALGARLDALERQADVMQRGYEVHSRLPIFGPFIAWVRRNLTSHLREPYLDPTLERQVCLNRELIFVLRELLQRQAALEADIERQEHDGDD